MDIVEQKAQLADDRINKLKYLIDNIGKKTLDPNAYIEILQEENTKLKNRIEKLVEELENVEKQKGVTPHTHQQGEGKSYVNLSAAQPSAAVGTADATAADQGKKSKKKAKDQEKSKSGAAPVSVNTAIDITRFDLRVGKIVSVEKHPDADTLYVEQIDVGEDEPRTVCSGLVKHMSMEDLDQKLVIVLCNLKGAKMRGILSEAMVMCASTPNKVELLEPASANVKPGDRVICDGYDCSSPDQQIKKELCDLILPDLRTNSNLEATYKNVPWKIANGNVQIKSKTLADVPIK